MRVLVVVKASKQSEAGEMPSEEMFRAMNAFNEQLSAAGIMLAGEGLHPSSKAKRIKFVGNERSIVDGPFAETKEMIAGFWIWQVKSMDEAVEWARRMPKPHYEDTSVDIRPIFSPEDFGDALPEDVRKAEEHMRQEAAKRM
jgi:hypothetical protein